MWGKNIIFSLKLNRVLTLTLQLILFAAFTKMPNAIYERPESTYFLRLNSIRC